MRPKFWKSWTGTFHIRHRVFGGRSARIARHVPRMLNAAQNVILCIVSHGFLHPEHRDPDHAALLAAPAVSPILPVKSVSLIKYRIP